MTQKAARSAVVLVGFMGAGKSRLAEALAQQASWSVWDVDALVEQQQGCTIRQIFARDGEAVFRRCETAAIKSLIAMPGQVVATGGGVLEKQENLPLLQRLGWLVWVDAVWPVLWQRIAHDTQRPLAAFGEARLYRRYCQRLAGYGQADYYVDTTYRAPADSAALLLQWLQRRSSESVCPVKGD